MWVCRASAGVAAAALITCHAAAADFHVMAGAADGDGSKTRPFTSLSQAESASAPGDRIFVVANPANAVLAGSIRLKSGQKLIGLTVTGASPREEAEMPLLTSAVVEAAIYDAPMNNGAYRPTTAVVKLARGVEVAGLHFVDIKGPALLAADENVSGTRIHDNAFSGVMENAKSMIYAIVLGGATDSSDVRVVDNVFRDGVTLGGVTVQQRGASAGAYYFSRNRFRDLGGRAYFLHSEDTSRVDSVILDSEANNLGGGQGVPGAGNADSIIPYLTGRSSQRVVVKNFRYRNDKQVGGISNTGLEVFIYGMRREEDRANWCVGCRADVEIVDSVFERPVSDAIQVANYGNRSLVNLSVRRTRIINPTPRQTMGAISTMAQRDGNTGGKINILVEDSDIIGSTAFAFANTNESGESVATVDFGGGALGSRGRNIIVGSRSGAFKLQGETAVARGNWWGGVEPTVTGVGSVGSADTRSPLSSPPQRRRAAMSNAKRAP